MTNGPWRRAKTTKVCARGLDPHSWDPCGRASGFLRLQDPLPHFLPLLPPGPRKGEELEEEWAPTERVSE